MDHIVEVAEGSIRPAPAATDSQRVASEAPSPDNLPNAISQRKLALEDSRRLLIRLGLSFALLILCMVGLGWWVGWRVIGADQRLEQSLDERTAKLQLVYEALHSSTQNSRITMQILLQKSATPELLARRAANTQKISGLFDALEKNCDSEQERQLLLAVKQTRATYVGSYLRALKLLLEEKNSKLAEEVMLKQTTPALFAYHNAWNELAEFELEQMTAAVRRATQRDLTTRRIGLLLQWLGAFLAAVIAVFTTSRMAEDIKLRMRMQEEVSRLNTKLEQKVAKRTDELVRAQAQLRESLAETQEYAKEIEAINELVKLLQSCLTLDEAHRQATCVLEGFFPSGAVLMLNPSRNLLDVVLSWGTAASKQGPFPPESCWALRKGQLHLAGPHSHNPVCSHCDDIPAGCHLCIPMMAQGDSLGLLSIDDPSLCGGNANSHQAQGKLKLATTLAEQISLAFANLMLRETLKYQSVRDPLTGLFNRRHMEESLERELLRAARNANPVTVLMLDIDHFKPFNDMFGHEAGDLLLRELGSLFKSQVRGADIACRYGGEEFLLIMAETDLELGRQRAECLRQQVAGLQLHYHGEMLRRITVSIGVAGFPQHGHSAAEIVNAADVALYQAKRAGRDRVMVAE